MHGLSSSDFIHQFLPDKVLEQDQYREVDASPSFSWVSKEVFYHFLQQGKKVGEAQALRELKGWVGQQLGSSKANRVFLA